MYSNGDGSYDWNAANINHIARHGVSPEDAEEVLANDPIDLSTREYQTEERRVQIGVTNAFRVLVIATTWRGDRLRVVTAYPAPPALKRYFFAKRWKTQ